MITPQERAKAYKNRSVLTKEQGPTSRQQTDSFVAWQRMSDILGQPFDVSSVPLSKLYQMRRDPMIAFALMYVKVPLVRAPWYIQSESAQISAFVDNALRQIYGRLIFQFCTSMEFGFQAIEKRFELSSPDWKYYNDETGKQELAWPDQDVKALVWKPFISLPPESVSPKWNNSGEFDGISFNSANIGVYGSQALRWDSEQIKNIDIEHALWITNEKDSVFGSLWRYPRIGYAFRYWWSYWYAWALSDRHYEKDADPATLVRYPEGRVLDDDGNEVDMRSLALQLGEDVRSGSTIAMPSKAALDMDGKTTGRYEWDIAHVTSGGNFQAFSDRFNYLDVMKLRSIMVPENSLIEGSGGTSSRNVADAMGDIFYESQAVTMADIDDHINRFIIPQIVVRNFPEYTGEVKKVTRGFSQADISLAKQIVQLIGQTDPNKLEVDVRTILEQAGVPLLSPQALGAKQDEINKELEQVTPGDIEPGGGQAGVKGGIYVNDKGKINLSLSDAKSGNDLFLHPEAYDSRFEDEKIAKIGQNLYKIWEDAFKEAYASAAKLLKEKGDSLSLAEDDGNEASNDSASKFLKAWVGLKFIKKAVNKTKLQQEILMDQASNLELAKVEITEPTWDAKRPEAQKWLNDHGAELLQNVSDTTKEEVRTWLAANFNKGLTPSQIAESFATHFSDYPSWKAARVVRTEVRDAYNASTLLSGEAEGCSQAIASDASGGRNINTDKHCIDRNGKTFSIKKAMKEKDHPNGTLSWVLVPPDVELSDTKRVLRKLLGLRG